MIHGKQSMRILMFLIPAAVRHIWCCTWACCANSKGSLASWLHLAGRSIGQGHRWSGLGIFHASDVGTSDVFLDGVIVWESMGLDFNRDDIYWILCRGIRSTCPDVWVGYFGIRNAWKIPTNETWGWNAQSIPDYDPTGPYHDHRSYEMCRSCTLVPWGLAPCTLW